MERLTGLDATFLYIETPEAHMHVAMTGIYDVTSMEGGYSFDSIKEHIRQRLHLVPPFRRRLVQVPFQFHHPVWIEDPNFNLDYHVRRIGCPAPGGRRELAEVAAQIASIPLDRTRPLWEAWVIEGLKQDRIGFVVKVHHSAIDGASGAEIMTEMYDLTPEGRELDPQPVEPERIPTDQELITYAALSKLRLARDSFGLVKRTVENVSHLVRAARDPHIIHGAVPLSAPRTPWNRSIGPHRAVSFARLPLDQAKAVKNTLGVTLNDVILAMCSGTLRRYLTDHGGIPEHPLIATCPVSVRVEDDKGTLGNKVSAMFSSLATDVEDPEERVRIIAASTGGAKTDHELIGARTLTDWAEWAAPRTFGLASRLYGSMNESLRPVHNLVISNVPGPPFPLYLGGAELVAAYPMGPVMDGAGLNITVLSYRNHIDIGFMADRELVPDVWELAEAVQPAFDELLALAEERDPTVTKSAASVTATSKAARRRAAADKKAGAKKAGATKRKAAAKKEPAAKKPASKKAATKKAATEKPASTRKRTVARKKPVATKTAPATVDTVAGAAPAHTVSDTSA